MYRDEAKPYASEKLKSALEQYSNAINKINLSAYKNIYLLSNGVLSRNPYINNLLTRLYKKDYKLSPNRFKNFVIFKLLSYYARSFVKLFSWLLQKFFFFLSGYRSSKLNKSIDGLVLIDTYFVVGNLKQNGYRDKACLSGLDDILEKYEKEYSYLPIFYGEKNPFKYISIFNGLKKSDADYITDYELLKLTDVVKIITFIIAYPFCVIRLANSLDVSDKVVALVKNELLITTNQITWDCYARYLVGRRIGEKTNGAKLISWCEYQSIQKNLYKGIHETNNSIKIFGCQFFLRFGDWVNIDIPNSEVDLGLAPDVVLVNGRSGISKNSKIPHKLGISLRNKKIFQIKNKNQHDETELFPIILLSYLESESKRLLQLIAESSYKDKKLYIKAHPALNLASLKPFIQQEWVVVDGDLYDRLEDANIVIVTASGTAAEAVAIGKTVIIIGNPKGITTNPLLSLGKGMIWDVAETAQDMTYVVNALLRYRVDHKESILLLSEQYKNLLFNHATEDDVLDMFDLK